VLKKYAYLLILVAIVVVGCESKEEKQLNRLYERASGYLEAGEHENAIKVFDQMLEIKDDPKIKEKLDNTIIESIEKKANQISSGSNWPRKKVRFESQIKTLNQMLEETNDPGMTKRLENLKNEIEAIEVVGKLIEAFKNIQNNIADSLSSDDIMTLIYPTGKLIEQLDGMKLGSNSNIAAFINSLNSNPVYQLYKSKYVNGSSILTDGYEDSFIIDSKIIRVEMVVEDILEEVFN